VLSVTERKPENINVFSEEKMDKNEKIFSRRQMLEMAIGFGGLTIFGGSVFAQQTERLATPEVGMGPFYPMLKPLEPNFQGFAVVTTDREGRYRFKTIKPGAYPISPTAQRPPHIHFDVEGKANRLMSQMFFPDEPLNEKDNLFLDLRSQSEKTAAAVIAQSLAPTREIEKDAMLLGWDIVLLNG